MHLYVALSFYHRDWRFFIFGNSCWWHFPVSPSIVSGTRLRLQLPHWHEEHVLMSSNQSDPHPAAEPAIQTPQDLSLCLRPPRSAAESRAVNLNEQKPTTSHRQSSCAESINESNHIKTPGHSAEKSRHLGADEDEATRGRDEPGKGEGHWQVTSIDNIWLHTLLTFEYWFACFCFCFCCYCCLNAVLTFYF